MQAIRALFAFRNSQHRDWFFVGLFLLCSCVVGSFVFKDPGYTWIRIWSVFGGLLHFLCFLGVLWDTRIGMRKVGREFSIDCIWFNGGLTLIYAVLFWLTQ